MDETNSVNMVPRQLLLGAGALILTSLLTVGFCRLSGLGGTHVDYAPPAQTRKLAFADQADGSIAVRDTASGVSWTLPRSYDGFVRVLLTSLMRDRRELGQAPDAEFWLNRSDSGSIWIEDPTTGRRIVIDAFGSGNALAFSKLMQTRGAEK